MKKIKSIALLLATGALILAPSANADVVLIEQAVNFKLKMTTLALPTVKLGSDQISAKLNTLSGSVTTKDILKTLGFSSSAKLIARVVADTTPNGEPAQAAVANQVFLQVVVMDGSTETDVTEVLADLVPVDNPIDALQDALYGTGVVKGTIKASMSKGLSASLQTLSYGHGSMSLDNLQLPKVGAVGPVEVDASGVSNGKISLKADLSYVTLGLSTTTKVVGGGTLWDPPLIDMAVPVVLDGTITTKGKNKLSTALVADLIDDEELEEDLEDLAEGFLGNL